MLSAKENRQSRRKQLGRKAKALALTGAVTTTAAALTAGITPPTAPASPRNLDVALTAASVPPPPGYPCGEGGISTCYPTPSFGVGMIGGLLPTLLNAFNMNPLSNTLASLGYDFVGNAATTKGLYNKINALDYITTSEIPNLTCKSASQPACRSAFIFTTGIGSLGVTDTIHALNESAQGNTREGFAPLETTPGGGLTNISAIYLNNMFRPNGGLASRFPQLMELLGLNPKMPEVGEVGPNTGESSVYSWITDLTWAYNTLADFPITANPLSLLNSMFAAVPPQELIQQLQTPGTLTDKLNAVFSPAAGTLTGPDLIPLVSLPSRAQCSACSVPYDAIAVQGALLSATAGDVPGSIPTSYTMTNANNGVLPLLYPTYIASGLVNPLLKKIGSPYLLGNPLADILDPALKILVNIGYGDVITPDRLDEVDTATGGDLTFAEEGYTAYDRTFYQTTPDQPTAFSWFNNPSMTSQQTIAAYQAAFKALGDALKAQAQKPFFGIVVPNTIPGGGAVTPSATSSAAAPKAAAAAAVAESTPAAIQAPAAPAVNNTPAPVVNTPAPAANDPAPAPVSNPAPAPTPAAVAAVSDNEPAAPAAPATRGKASRGAAASTATAGQAGNDNNTGNTGRAHRGGRSAD